MNILILGANGIVGQTLAEELKKRKEVAKLILAASSFESKTEAKVVFQKVDALDKEEVNKALHGIHIVFLTIGLTYKLSIWEHDWPIIMENVLQACKKNKTKLVFFDNVYAYGLVNGEMTENTPLNPCSRKGVVRQKLQNMIKDAIKKGEVKAVIAKSADYYGPQAKQSLLYVNTLENVRNDKKPAWLGDPKTLHSFTYLPDAAKALVELGFSDKANNQVWHLPTTEPLTGKEYLQLISQSLNKRNAYTTYSKMLIRIVGLFNSLAKELVEMFYQNDTDYIFNSKKFEKSFKTKPTPYYVGIKKTVESFS